MTLVILALDALDAELVEYFDIDAYRLNTHREIETFANMNERPYTLEVWPTVATGLTPEEHGVTFGKTSQWENPLLELGSRITGHLSERTRTRLGRLAERTVDAESSHGQTDQPTIFDGDANVVHNWPGVTDGSELQHVWDLMVQASRGEIPKEVFDREVLATAAEQFGWAKEMLRHEVGVAGVHVHALDAAGHSYGESEADLRRIYERVGEFVGEIEALLTPDDDLLVISDHGMNTSFTDPDKKPSAHSWRAFASTTYQSLPDSVFEVKDWVEEHSDSTTVDRTNVELPEEQLRDLGYM